ncbi:tetratricopeptide repeat protein [Actinomadura sp. HBU206391]|uniref:tetratricopeptide repeat protein n=1 Tax=Actinomadura sp. HBU206391 TaxID=2731692 RepID=UPI0016504724|nr:tetratricopeptide repeat protein [Actinomadura sp. HBU206391]MBC6463071.1 tetratricopeptide repeat protein [Actinomadura sp. HBU206391]
MPTSRPRWSDEGEDLALLAPHYRDAHDQVGAERALEVLTRAGERALDVLAGKDAAGYLEAARSHATVLAHNDGTSALLERLGDAQQTAGRLDAAVAAWEEALEAYRQSGDHTAVARLHQRLAFAVWDQGRFERAQELLAEGFAALPVTGPDLGLGLRETHARLVLRLGDLPTVRAEVGRLRAAGQRAGSLRTIAVADMIDGDAQLREGPASQAHQTYLRALTIAERLADPALIEQIHRPLTMVELMLDGPEPARRRGLYALQVARTFGVPPLEMASRLLLVLVDFHGGDWEQAQRGAIELLALGHRVSSVRAAVAGLIGQALVFTFRGDIAEAAACLTEARTALGPRPADRRMVTLIQTIEAQVARERGDPDQAVAAAADLATNWLISPAFSLAVLGGTQIAAGGLDAALGTADRLKQFGPRALYPAALAKELMGLVHGTRGDQMTALRELGRATERFTTLAMPFDVARCRLQWSLAAPPKRRDEAVIAAQSSLTVFTAVGARRYADRARRLLRGSVDVKGPAGQSVVTIDVDLIPPQPQSSLTSLRPEEPPRPDVEPAADSSAEPAGEAAPVRRPTRMGRPRYRRLIYAGAAMTLAVAGTAVGLLILNRSDPPAKPRHPAGAAFSATSPWRLVIIDRMSDDSGCSVTVTNTGTGEKRY